jgi:hypothetical protein
VYADGVFTVLGTLVLDDACATVHAVLEEGASTTSLTLALTTVATTAGEVPCEHSSSTAISFSATTSAPSDANLYGVTLNNESIPWSFEAAPVPELAAPEAATDETASSTDTPEKNIFQKAFESTRAMFRSE